MLWATILLLFQSQASPWQFLQPDHHSCEHMSFQAFEPLSKAPVSFIPGISTQLAAPQITGPLNTSVGEQWAFDATSADGNSGLLIGFYHDPTYAFLGPGNLRLSLDVVWPNGSTWSLVDYLAIADVHVCNNGTTGVWSKDGGLSSYSFFIAANNELAMIKFRTPRVQGSVTIQSLVPARFPDGSTTSKVGEQPSTFNAPALHWVEPIPAGKAEAYLILDGWPIRWYGMGGMEHWWAGQGWLDAMQGWRAARVVIGPYVLTYWAPTSRLNAGVLYPSALLAQGGKRIFSATRSGPAPVSAPEEPYIEYRGIFANGSLMAPNGDAGTNKKGILMGYVVTLIAPKQKRRWEFTLLHKNMEFEFDLGDSAGGVAYVGTASGGEIGGKVYQGVFFNEWVDVTKLAVPSAYVTVASWYYRAKAWIGGH